MVAEQTIDREPALHRGWFGLGLDAGRALLPDWWTVRKSEAELEEERIARENDFA